jgi:hypothetical protein
MARDVRSKLHTYGAGDPDRAMALADLVIQDPLMQLAIAKHMEQHQGIDTDIVDCIGNLLSSLIGANHRGPMMQAKEAVRALILRASYVDCIYSNCAQRRLTPLHFRAQY